MPAAYPGPMAAPAVHDFLRRHAPQDVRDTVRWLEEHGYQLTSSPTQAQSSFGALMVFTGDAEVEILCDRSQWFLAVAPTPGGERMQYDLLYAASRGLDYWDCFPRTADVPDFPMPEQEPVGVSWRSNLPAVLDWIRGPGVAEACNVPTTSGTR